MPTYEYACRSCEEHLEVVQSFRDDPLSECPACGGELKKVFGNVGIVFKGSGFYKTDSRSKSSGAKESKSDTKSESKSETKSESKSSDSSSGSGSSAGSEKTSAAS